MLSTPRHANFWGGWWTNPKRVGLNVSYLVSRQTAYQVAVERDNGRLTGKPEIISSPLGLVPTNALVLTGLATFWVVGKPEGYPTWTEGLVLRSRLVGSHRLVPRYRVLGTTLTAHSQLKYRAHLLLFPPVLKWTIR